MSPFLYTEMLLSSRDDKLTKVKQAMLSMQRASWEQGVAAQAFLVSEELLRNGWIKAILTMHTICEMQFIEK